MYYNTTNQKSEVLKDYTDKSLTQNDRVLDVFMKAGEMGASPSQVLTIVNRTGKNYPLTSIRRAITDLTAAGKLIKTEQTTYGLYGRPEYVWKLAPALKAQDCDI